MSDVAALADEFVETLFDQSPLWPALLGMPSMRQGLGEVSAEADQAFRATLVSFIDRAKALEPSVTREVLIAQAEGKIQQIDARIDEFAISDIFISPASGLLATLPMVAVGDAEQAEAQLARLVAIPKYLD